MRYLITVVIAALSLNAFGQSGVCNYPISNVPTVVLLEENGVWLSATSSDPLIWDLDVVADSIFVTSCGVYQVQELVDFGDGWALPCAFISEIYVLNEGCTLTPDVCGDGTVWNAATSTCISANTADINNDGWPDIYVATAMKKGPGERNNLLFVNQGKDAQGNIRFKEMASQYCRCIV